MRVILPLVLLSSLWMVPSANAGRIVVNHDEWTTSDTGFAADSTSATNFVQNVATFISGGVVNGNFLVYSSNFSLAGASFATALTSEGHTLTVSTAVTFDLATLMTYDGVFLALNPGGDTTVLTNYVNAGGGVYLAGGTGFGGATVEANTWNPFLNNFGLGLLGGSYNGVSGSLAVNGVHPIFSGVSTLYYNNGSTVVLSGVNPNAQIVESLVGGPGLIGVYDGTTSSVPEPTTMLLFGGGLAALFLRRRSKTV